MYHAAQALLLTEDQKTETNKGVVTLFSLLFVKTGKFSKNLGKYLSNLKDDRAASDFMKFSPTLIMRKWRRQSKKEESLLWRQKYLISKGILE